MNMLSIAKNFTLPALVATASFAVWAMLNASTQAPDVTGKLYGLSYSPFQRHQDPSAAKFPSEKEIADDLKSIANTANAVRTYSAAQFPALATIAQGLNLKVQQGVWLTGQTQHDQKEVLAAVTAANSHPVIERLIVGNETQLKSILPQAELIRHLKQVKSLTNTPVSTAEPWNIWLANPALAEHVDFITVHLLPYWEGIAIDNAVGHSIFQIEQLKRRFPNKPIVIGEVGWPSHGDPIDRAVASPANQARFVREFVQTLRQSPAHASTPFFLMEAYDQVWKIKDEGLAGGYWGLFDAQRVSKYALTGPIENDPFWLRKALISSLLGFVLLAACLPRLRGLTSVARFAIASSFQCVIAGAIALLTIPFGSYMRITDWIALAIFFPTFVIMVTILLAHCFEFSELFWRGSLRRLFPIRPLLADQKQARVSIHLACCNEPPDMVIATLNSLAKLNYANFEVIVVDNNTQDPRDWKPVEAYVAQLGENFKFFHLPSWPGYKAGALNFALSKADKHADIIGVVDADYVVHTDWLHNLVGYFDSQRIGVVQSPQAHRGWDNQIFRRMMNWEYEGFFRIGMHHRNERNAIVQHGTMTLINAKALREHGQWSEWCVCEDTELGLRLLKQGYSTLYVDVPLGHGLTPDSFIAFKKQRTRWAQGGMQIFRSHFSALLGRKAKSKTNQDLSRGQRYHFLSGWLPWVGDALHLVFAIAAIAWTIGVLIAPRWITLPTPWFMAPLATFIVAKLLFGPLLYMRRVPCSAIDILGASLAGMGVSHAIARGVLKGLFTSDQRFVITDKGNTTRNVNNNGKPTSIWHGIRDEAVMLTALVTSATIFLLMAPAHLHGVVTYKALWASMLLVQAMPYAAALICAKLSTWPSQTKLNLVGNAGNH